MYKIIYNNRFNILFIILICLVISCIYTLKNKNKEQNQQSISNINNNVTNNINNTISNTVSNTVNDTIIYTICDKKKLISALKYVLDKHNSIFIRDNNIINNWNLYLPCGYNFETELNTIKILVIIKKYLL